MSKVYAEDVNYWQTSQSQPDTWIDRAKAEIASVGGKVQVEMFGATADGRSAFMLGFTLGGDQFKIEWPVLPSRTGKDKAAKVQAATLLYHDVKHKVVMAKVRGIRAAFLEYLMLPDGSTAGQAVSNAQSFFAALSGVPRLSSGQKS